VFPGARGLPGRQAFDTLTDPEAFYLESRKLYRAQEKRRLTLIDLNGLVALLIEHFEKLDEHDRNRLPLKPVHFLSLD